MTIANAAVLFWSKTGNTRKVAEAIHGALLDCAVRAELVEIGEQTLIDYSTFDLLFLGAPVYSFLPPQPVTDCLRRSAKAAGHTLPAAPEIPGRNAVVFCTYGGGHTGEREAVPALKYLGQFLEHAGVRVVDEWAIVGEFPGGGEEYNRRGRLGDIRGRPTADDLARVRGLATGLLRRLGAGG